MAQRANRDQRGGNDRLRPAAKAASKPTRGLSLRRRPAPAAPARRRSQGRYTAPTPREVRHSPRWYPWVLLFLAVAGVGIIIANYASGLPASPSNWYTLGALIALLGSALLATRYR